MSRRLSYLTDRKVVAKVGDTYSSCTAIVFALNMTLGTGPLTLPFAFAKAGFLLSAVFLGVCALLGYITAAFLIESLVLGNVAIVESAESELLQSAGAEPNIDDLDAVQSNTRMLRPDKVFRIRERIELGEMGQRLLPSPLHELLYVFLFLYTFGTLCVYAVTVSTSIEAMLPAAMRSHAAVIIGFAAMVFPLCFADMQKLRSLQSIIMALRVVAIAAMLFGAIYQLTSASGRPDCMPSETMWLWNGIPLADINGLPSLFANAVLSFMVHHSLPGLLAPVEHQEQAPRVIRLAYVGAYSVYLILGASALSAFGCQVPQLYNLAFSAVPVPFLGQFLCGYPLMLFAIYPIVSITLRNNLMNVLHLPPPGSPDSKPAVSVLATALASLPPVCVAYVTSNVQAIVSVFAGYFGLSLMLLMPCLLLIWARSTLERGSTSYPLRARLGTRPVYALVIVAYLSAIAFNTYRLLVA